MSTRPDLQHSTQPASAGRHARLHPDVLKLGLVSLLTDVSSEMIFSVFAVFFTTVVGASTALLGLIEGLADLAASSLTWVAGWLSDRSGKRKAFALAGYGFSTLAKSLLLVATTVAGLGAFRVIERVGKGVRGPPRDAWLASIAPQSARGYAFGVHKALDKSGAVIGPLLAYALLSRFGESAAGYRTLFWVAFIPAVLGVVVLQRVADRPVEPRMHERMTDGWRLLSPGFKRFLIPAGVFSLAYYSLGFMLLKAHVSGFSVGGIVLLYALFNATCVLAAPWVGRLGDRIGRRPVIVLGYALYGAVNLGMACTGDRWQVIALFAVYGLFHAIDESQSKAFIADLEPQRRATASGVHAVVTGTIYLPASLLAGALWGLAPEAAFLAATLLSVLAIVCFAVLRPVA